MWPLGVPCMPPSLAWVTALPSAEHSLVLLAEPALDRYSLPCHTFGDQVASQVQCSRILL